MDMLMEEMSKVYMLEVLEEEDFVKGREEIVAMHMCGLSGRPVVSPSREGSCVATHHGHQRT